MNFSLSTCGCGGNTGMYSTNMWNVNGNQPGNQGSCHRPQNCDGCTDTFKATCILYNGPNRVNTGINKNDNLDLIIQKLDALQEVQALKNTNILLALNDINTRLNTITGGSHDPYSLL